MQSQFRTIGVLGGMGPEATVLLQQKLIAAVGAKDDADHIPLLIDMNPQVPSRIAHLIEGTGADPSPCLAAMARRLSQAGAEALAIPCNTAHHYAGAVTQSVNIPLLNMVDLAVAHVAALCARGDQVGILGSPAVHKIALFDAPLAANGLRAAWPQDEAAMLGAIQSIKKEGASVAARDTLRAASEALVRKGAVVQLVACSEFSIIANAVAPEATVIDTLDVLVAAMVRFAQGS